MMLRSTGRLVLSVLVGCAIGACGAAPEDDGANAAALSADETARAEGGSSAASAVSSRASGAQAALAGDEAQAARAGASSAAHRTPERRPTIEVSHAEATWCDAPAILAPGVQVLPGQRIAIGRGPALACFPTDGAPRAYQLFVPRGFRAKVSAAPRTPGLAVIVQVSDSCESRACLAQGGSRDPGVVAEAVLDNRTQGTLTAVVAVTSQSAAIGGEFDLAVTYTALDEGDGAGGLEMR